MRHFLPSDRGDSLQSRRLALNLTAAQLSQLADCSVSTINKVEEGSRPRRSPVLVRAYAALERLEAERALGAAR